MMQENDHAFLDKSSEQNSEVKEHEPVINYHIFYSAHITAEDLKKLREELSTKPDIYIPEISGWNEEAQAIYTKIAKGELDPEALSVGFKRSDPSRFEEFKILYKTQQRVLFADTPENHEITIKTNEIMERFSAIYTLFYAGYYKPAIKKLEGLAKAFNAVQKEREHYIEQQLNAQITDLSKKDEELKNKDVISVLLRLGWLHTGIYHSLKERESDNTQQENLRVTRIFDRNPAVYSLFDELLRRYRFNKVVTEDDLARSLLEIILEKNIHAVIPVGGDSSKAYEVTRKLFGNLKAEEVKGLCERTGKGGNLMQELQKTGITPPKTLEEVEAMLGKNKF